MDKSNFHCVTARLVKMTQVDRLPVQRLRWNLVSSDPIEELRKRVIELITGCCFNFAWSRALGSLASTRTGSLCVVLRGQGKLRDKCCRLPVEESRRKLINAFFQGDPEGQWNLKLPTQTTWGHILHSDSVCLGLGPSRAVLCSTFHCSKVCFSLIIGLFTTADMMTVLHQVEGSPAASIAEVREQLCFALLCLALFCSALHCSAFRFSAPTCTPLLCAALFYPSPHASTLPQPQPHKRATNRKRQAHAHASVREH